MAARKSGDRWIVEFMYRGKRIFRRLPKGQTKADAQALETRLRSNLFNAAEFGTLPDPSLEAVIRELTKDRDAKGLSHVNAVLANLPKGIRLSEVSKARDALVVAWKDLAPGTINRRLSVLKATCKSAFRRKWTSRNLSPEVAMLREPRYTRREVHPSMAQKLLEAATTRRAKALIAGAAYTGMRLSEVLRFDPKRDLEGDVIRVRETKTGEDRLIPLPPELKPYLDQFPMKSGWRNVYRGFERAREKAGLTIRYHDLRHMAATAMINAGVDSRIVGDILGHKSVQTTRKYTHPSMEAKRKALGAITAGLHQGKGKKPRNRGS